MRFLSILCILITATIVLAQNDKEPLKEKKGPLPPPPPKIVIDNPAKADPDFAIQGEYEDAAYKVGAQVIARGGGAFVVRMLKGGLPGAGWDGETQHLLAAKMAGGKISIAGKDPRGGNVFGTIQNGELTLTGDEFVLKRVVRKSPTLGEKPPPGALVLFDRPEDVERWREAKIADLADGKFLAATDKTTLSKDIGRNFKLHLEFRLAYMPDTVPQARSLSGVYFQNRYELHIRDSFGLNATNSDCGSFTSQHAPLINMCFPPLTWQTYDIDFKGPEFDKGGKRTKPACATVKHNGILIHDNVELPGHTSESLTENDKPGPLRLVWRPECRVVFRNIWMVEEK